MKSGGIFNVYSVAKFFFLNLPVKQFYQPVNTSKSYEIWWFTSYGTNLDTHTAMHVVTGIQQCTYCGSIQLRNKLYLLQEWIRKLDELLKTERMARYAATITNDILWDQRHELKSLPVSSVLLQAVQQIINPLTALNTRNRYQQWCTLKVINSVLNNSENNNTLFCFAAANPKLQQTRN